LVRSTGTSAATIAARKAHAAASHRDLESLVEDVAGGEVRTLDGLLADYDRLGASDRIRTLEMQWQVIMHARRWRKARLRWGTAENPSKKELAWLTRDRIKTARRARNRPAVSLAEGVERFADRADSGPSKKERVKEAERFAAWAEYVAEELLTRPVLPRVAAPVLHSSDESTLGEREAGDAIVTPIHGHAPLSSRRPSRLSRSYSTNIFDDDDDDD
jgi:hypothetical protein